MRCFYRVSGPCDLGPSDGFLVGYLVGLLLLVVDHLSCSLL